MSTNRKISILISIAILFHLIGVIGIGILHSDTMLKATPFHLVLMFVLLLLSYEKRLLQFLKWVILTFAIGFVVELIGVHTGLIFGDYTYGVVLGYKVYEVPVLIGVNWVMVLVGAIALSSMFIRNKWVMILIAATLATVLDWLIEPVAIKLGYWSWAGHGIPFYNYVCWWAVSILLAFLWTNFKLKANNFSAILFIIQAIFFAILHIL